MSMKFFSGIQDLLGMYEGGLPLSPSSSLSASSSPSAAATDAASLPGNSNANAHSHQIPSPSLPIPPIFTREQHQTPRKRSAAEVNKADAVHAKADEPVRRCSHNRRVRFPEAEAALVTGFHDAPRSPFHFLQSATSNGCATPPPTPDPAEMIHEYEEACKRLGTRPFASVERQINCFHRGGLAARQEQLSLKGERVTLSAMESLESIFQRFQFESLDFEYTFLDDETAISLGEMIEFYDSAHRLNLSFNKAISLRGWNAIFKAVRNCSSLNVLNLRYTSLSDKALPSLCRTLRAQPSGALVCLHLENVSLMGKNLLLVVCALKTNTTLKELYLGENNLQPSDGAHLYQLIVSNTSIQMLDLRNNQLQDGGLRHICDGLRHAETLQKSSLSAIVLWNNRLSGQSIDALATALQANPHLETLNIGCNRLGTEGVSHLKRALQDTRCNLHRLGLQSTGIDCQGAIVLAECLAENNSMVRVDLRDNSSIGSAGLLALHSAMKMNTTITLLNLDPASATANLSAKVREYQDEFRRLYEEMLEACERNKNAALAAMRTTLGETEEEKKRAQEAEKERVEEGEAGSEGEGARDNHCEAALDASTENGKATNEPSGSASPTTVSPSPETAPSSGGRLLRRFYRSTSLTCSETVADIHERIQEMKGSSQSLDETCSASSSGSSVVSTIPALSPSAASSLSSHSDSVSTIKKGSGPSWMKNASPAGAKDWGSLPSLNESSTSQSTSAAPSFPSAAPVVRKTRRFSVSPTSSTFEIIPYNIKPSTRPTTLSLEIGPASETASAGPSSAPIVLSPPEWNAASLGSFQNVVSPLPERLRIVPSPSPPPVLSASTSQSILADVRSVVADLVNYVVYEEESVVERKRSLLLSSTSAAMTAAAAMASLYDGPPPPFPSPSSALTSQTPSKMLSMASALSSLPEMEADAVVVRSVVHSLVREVAKAEKLSGRRRDEPGRTPSLTPSSSSSSLTSFK